MRQAHHGVFARRNRAPLVLGVVAALVAAARPADAQVGSANVPLPNVLLLLDTSGSFEHMIDGSNPEDTGPGPYNLSPTGNNNPSTSQYANCETAWNNNVPALPNRWGVAVQALTGTMLKSDGSAPFYSCVTMDRASGPAPSSLPAVSPLTRANGLDLQYGIRDELQNFYYPYDSGYYLPFHRPVSATGLSTTTSNRCVYSPNALPGASLGGVGLTAGKGGTPAGDCPTEPSGSCQATDYPADAIGTYVYDSYPLWAGPMPATLPNPNLGYSSNTQSCNFNQASDGMLDQAGTLVRFGLMTFDNDPDPDIGVNNGSPMLPIQTGMVSPYVLTPTPELLTPFTGQWSYFSRWDTQCATAALTPTSPWTSPSTGEPTGCTTGPQLFELGARNPAAPPWEGRLLGFPNPNTDVNGVGQANLLVQSTINSMRPYGATPTAALMADAEYYFWGDPTGPGQYSATPDPFVAGGCRSQYIILLTDGAPNQDMRTSCQGGGAGYCPYQLPEDTASVLANGVSDAVTGYGPGMHGNVFTYVIGFAVSGNAGGTDTGSANCAALAANPATFTATCNLSSPFSATDSSTGALVPLPQQQNTPVGAGGALESPCCSLERIAVAGGTQHAYFADTPGDLNAALAAVIGEITGQLGSRTLPVAAPTISYASGAPLTATFLSSFQAATCPAGHSTANGGCNYPWQSSGPWTGQIARQEYTCPAGGGAAVSAAPVASDDIAGDLLSDFTAQNQSGGRNFVFFNGTNSNNSNISTNALTIRPYLQSHVVTNNLGGTPPPDGLDTFGANGQTGAEVTNFGLGGSPSNIYSALSINNGVALAIQPTSCQDPYCSGGGCPGSTAGYLDQQTCANLALSFAMAQQSAPSLGTTPDQYLTTAYQNGQDGLNLIQPTNRWSAPLGAILDSTPAVVAAPNSLVRDDSYQAFATAFAGLTTPRDTTLYVASIDGLLHAFDTSAGIGSGVSTSKVESWSFVPPAVLPHLISNYPGASNILLDGSPVVKDVIFSRCENPGAVCGAPPNSQWVQNWHTMLVGGFGQGGRGYYAMDVTDPRPPAAAVSPPSFTSSAFPTFAQAGSPPTLTTTGPHFQWQITSLNLTGTAEAAALGANFNPNQIFGKVSGTPAITTVYADPTNPRPGQPTNPQEIGVAILPGGRDGLPAAGVVCPRELTRNSPNYQTTAPLYSTVGLTGKPLPAASPFNVGDANFPARVNVRGWAPHCYGKNSAVAGRSVMVVSVATGQILALFARAPSTEFLTSSDPSAWDVPTDGHGNTLIGGGGLPYPGGQNPYLIGTPLDSPMTGTPVVYPSGVGVVAQAAYIGDADGTMWRFDLSDPNPRNWTGAIFADAYATTADTSGGDVYPATLTDWTALDSEAISVEPQIALDTSANPVIDFATGDQTAFNACYSAPGSSGSDHTTNSTCTGNLHPTVNFIYSVREARGGGTPYHAVVNWYQEWTTGERVTGPMAIFNGILYFATYVPPGGSSIGCNSGGANLYAWDFAHPSVAGCGGAIGDSGSPIGCGGVGTLDPNFAPAGELSYSALQAANPAITVNTVIPGVAVASTPSCTVATPNGIPSDAYTGGNHTTTSTPTPGNFSLMANIGKGKKTAAQNLVTQKLQAPTAPTVVDSWAAIAE